AGSAARLRDLVGEHEAGGRALAALRAELCAAQTSAEQIDIRLVATPDRRRALERLLTQTERTACQQDRWAAELTRSRDVRDAAIALTSARQVQQRVVELGNQAHAELNRRTARVNDVVRARLEGAAAWLAGRLVQNEDCPVCGSLDHPRPHPQIDSYPSDADEQEARHREEIARAAAAAVEATVTEAREAVARLRATSDGLSPDDARLAFERVESELGSATDATEEVARLRTEIVELDEALTRDRQQQQVAAALVSELGERLRGLEQAHAGRESQLVRELGPSLDLQPHLDRVAHVDGSARELLRSLRDLEAATSEHTSALSGARQAAVAAGFAGLETARASMLAEVERSDLREHLLRRHDDRLRVEDVLTDPEVAASLERPEPPVEELTARLAEETAASSVTARVASVLRARRQEVGRLTGEAQAARAAWLPRRQSAAVADAMASLVEGKAADNRLQVSLSAFVLASRLRQVVDAANERFVPMSSGRYFLEHTMDKAPGDRRSASGGLGLLVRDQWTGQTRDPRTLSGGETFWASLSLALGLSDVVTHETGGVELHTLFVDEGFGSLDADSLDDVMDVLDCLRSGGRTVGVVSHVETMRERIATQVRVTKARVGSAVAQA
ncbi:MAG: SMC family ATPase, partial [Actinomycetota bacterium]|nr:SMC family ATPase [Actinomycetota bacterium]